MAKALVQGVYGGYTLNLALGNHGTVVYSSHAGCSYPTERVLDLLLRTG